MSFWKVRRAPDSSSKLVANGCGPRLFGGSFPATEKVRPSILPDGRATQAVAVVPFAERPRWDQQWYALTGTCRTTCPLAVSHTTIAAVRQMRKRSALGRGPVSLG